MVRVFWFSVCLAVGAVTFWAAGGEGDVAMEIGPRGLAPRQQTRGQILGSGLVTLRVDVSSRQSEEAAQSHSPVSAMERWRPGTLRDFSRGPDEVESDRSRAKTHRAVTAAIEARRGLVESRSRKDAGANFIPPALSPAEDARPDPIVAPAGDVAIPVVYQPDARDETLPEAPAAQLRAVRDRFEREIAAEEGDPESADYRARWRRAQWTADQQYRAMFGQQAFLARQIAGARAERRAAELREQP